MERLFTAISSEVILINEQKSWTEAQSFCREFHVDLPTVQTDEDRLEIQKASSGANAEIRAWVGLYGSICVWRWSYQSHDLQFSFWAPTEDPSLKTQSVCAVIRNDGFWYATNCTQLKPFICYKGNHTFSLLKKNYLTWSDAQSLCRAQFVDLAFINDVTDNTDVLNYLIRDNVSEAWIGLNKNQWLWSDQSSVSWPSLGWASGEPNNGYGDETCANAFGNGLLVDENCNNLFFFFCVVKRVKAQVVRLAVKSSALLDEPAMKLAMEKKMRIILSKLETDPAYNITWRVQADGKTFKPLENNARNTTTVCKREQGVFFRGPR
ncbi:secretory phospholipase A2 receptor-like [Danio aesculapii]|uniref:secretory phospholipase A2 receptor-like n=1 Tax=Danio aesculapii TaxID=1142201 RepID=UPI0024C02363|nr:secretory phospholipase A2 receptor-like [Danio aesculapii]